MASTFNRSLLAALLSLAACDETTSPATTPPTTGSAMVQVATSGTGSIGAGYRVELDGITLDTITAAGTLVLAQLAPGAHTILIRPIALTCTPDWYVPQAVSIEAGRTTLVPFSVRCDTLQAPGLVFSSTRDNNNRNIYRMDLDGGNVQPLTAFPLGGDHPSASPGGTRIAFMRQGVWLMNADGGSPVKLSSFAGVEEEVRWAPDGSHLAFMRWTGPYQRAVIVATPDGRQEVTVIEGSSLDGTAPSSPQWSPDGTRLAVTINLNGRYGIRVVDATDGSSPVDFLPADTLLEAFVESWTPDGQLLFCRWTRSLQMCDVVIAPPGGGSEVVLADTVDGFVSAEYSRDGSTIALTAWGPGYLFDIFTMPASGGSLTNLTNAPSHDMTPSWLP